MDTEFIDRNLTCILFPGIVKNNDKAIECLGGIRNISQAYAQSMTRRLGLSFQPENPFVKKAYANVDKCASLLLKVKIKKKKNCNKVEREVISTSVLGRVDKMFKFDSFLDFQYLPLSSNGVEDTKCCFEKLVPSGIDSFDWMSEPAQSFIVPIAFTRAEKPFHYRYTDKKYGLKKEVFESEVHQRMRPVRGHKAHKIAFKMSEEFPLEPNQFYLDTLESKKKFTPGLDDELEILKRLYEERPIWSKNGIQFQSKLSSSSLKILLPCIGFYICGASPWRLVWVKYGYDPRKDPSSRIYQTLDFRVRSSAGVNSMIGTREQIKKIERVRVNLGVNRLNKALNFTSDEVLENAVKYRPGMMPSQRQIFYQYCDIELPEVQDLVSRLADPPPGALCHPSRGWLPPGFDQQCRDCLFSHVKQVLLQRYKEGLDDIKFEGGAGSSDEEQESDEDIDNTAESEFVLGS